MSKLTVFVLAFIIGIDFSNAQPKTVAIGTVGYSEKEGQKLKLSHRFQNYKRNTKNKSDIFDSDIQSPKSVNILESADKFYVHSLEGHKTVVYKLSTLEKMGTIYHHFNSGNAFLFKDTTLFDYTFQTRTQNFNIFKGKPVESCFTHSGKFLWVTYYRRDFDANAIDPSAVCIINTQTDQIVRVMPTAPLPKMIAASPNQKTLAITHWGDNTIALLNIESNNPMDWKYTHHIAIGKRMGFKISEKKIDRDSECGLCLRGTVFTPDSNYLLIAEMGGSGIAVVNVNTAKMMGTVYGMVGNIRHLVINGGVLYASSNKYGMVLKTSLKSFLEHANNTISKPFSGFENLWVGSGARTISVSEDGLWLFAAVNSASKLVLINLQSWAISNEIYADSYPVGLDITSDAKTIVVTSQGKSGGGGNSVMIFKRE